jgi:hypothetical protein
MLGAALANLTGDAPAGTGAALDVVAGFDEGLTHGFGRLGDQRVAALSALAGAVAATPLGTPVAEAVDKIVVGPVTDEHLAALAGARTALLGAVHDALLDRLDAALGRTRAAWPAPLDDPPVRTGDDAAGNQLRGADAWLHELAITGWRGVDHDLVSASDQTVAALLAQPGLRRLAVLLDGLAAELRACCPIATMECLPARRWADLWARALLLSRAGGRPGSAAASPVSGRLLVLGVDVHESGTAVQVQVHGVLEPAGGAPPRLVRTSVAAAKVETIVGPAVWRLLDDHPVLLAALAGRRSLDVTDLPLLDGGDLLWHDDRARAGEAIDPFATARVRLAGAPAPAVAPLDRHPVRIAEPVLVEGYTTSVQDGALTLDLDGSPLPVAVDRLPSCGPLTPQLVAGSSACLGLLRWDDGRWSLQPLAIQSATRRTAVTVHTGDWALGPTDKTGKPGKAGGDAAAVLRERAGRLLRR